MLKMLSCNSYKCFFFSVLFQLDKNVFEVDHSGDQDGDKFPMPFDVPVTKYSSSDKPWVTEFMMS
jgi:hypothetical protein